MFERYDKVKYMGADLKLSDKVTLKNGKVYSIAFVSESSKDNFFHLLSLKGISRFLLRPYLNFSWNTGTATTIKITDFQLVESGLALRQASARKRKTGNVKRSMSVMHYRIEDTVKRLGYGIRKHFQKVDPMQKLQILEELHLKDPGKAFFFKELLTDNVTAAKIIEAYVAAYKEKV